MQCEVRATLGDLNPINPLCKGSVLDAPIVQCGCIWGIKAERAYVYQREDYLTVGVVVRRRWLGLEGRGGLMLREGVCEDGVAPSVLKVFIS